MGLEIERKFTVKKDIWATADKGKGKFLRQGYLISDGGKTVRIRASEDEGFITIKGPTTGASRLEYEYKIPRNEAIELLDHFAITDLTKVRYEVIFKEKLWEVDVFEGHNQGLIIAEIELSSEDETFELPNWIDYEVTGDKRYYNSNLAKEQ